MIKFDLYMMKLHVLYEEIRTFFSPGIGGCKLVTTIEPLYAKLGDTVLYWAVDNAQTVLEFGLFLSPFKRFNTGNQQKGTDGTREASCRYFF